MAPGLAIERVTDLALRAVPAVEPGILFVERQFGVLEVHAPDLADVERAGQAILAGLGAGAADQLRPKILFSDVIDGHHRPAGGDHQPQPRRLDADPRPVPCSYAR